MPCVYLPGPAPAVTVANNTVVYGKYRISKDIKILGFIVSRNFTKLIIDGMGNLLAIGPTISNSGFLGYHAMTTKCPFS
jgi:hypothetical protein